jgi:hypothetical protein
MGAPGANPELEKEVSKWFTLSIVTIFCGCCLLGLIPVLMANQAKEALARGDQATAAQKIKTARMLCLLGFAWAALSAVLWVVYFILGMIGVIPSLVST